MKKFSMIWVLVFCFVSCVAMTPARFKTDQPLYEHCKNLFDRKKYIDTLEYVEYFKNHFQESPYLPEIELMYGDAHFESKHYPEAISAYQTFMTLHPKHEAIPRVYFYIGRAYLKEAPEAITRDQSNSQQAIDAFQILIDRYPDSSWVPQSKEYQVRAKRKLFQKELYTADYYLRTQHPQATNARLKELTQNFSKYEPIAEEDLKEYYFLLAKTSSILKNTEEQKKAVESYSLLQKPYPKLDQKILKYKK